MRILTAFSVFFIAIGCSNNNAGGDDDSNGFGGTAQGGSPDGGNAQGGSPDGGNAQGGSPDGGNAQGGSPDGGTAGAGTAQGGSPDGGTAGAGTAQGGSSDGGTAGTGAAQGGSSDGGNAQGGSSEADSPDVVFSNVNIIPMTSEAVLENLSVHVSNGQIVAINSFESLSPPDDATIVDGTGKYLTPGFSDMHVHFFGTSPTKEYNLFLANGVTTVRNMWGTPAILSARDAINEGDLLGPKIYTTGPIIDGPNSRLQNSFILADVDSVEPAITEMKVQGYDFIKVYDDLSIDVYDEIMRVALGHGLPVAGHVPRTVGVNHAIQSGLFSIEHLAQYLLSDDSDLDEQIALTVESGIWNCPTLLVLNACEDWDAARSRVEPIVKYVEPSVLSQWAGATNSEQNFADRMELLQRLHGEGANIVSGSDTGNPYIIAGFSLLAEFELMQASGLTPYEVLLATTVNAATMLGTEDRSGTIEPGKDADLVLLESNPLENIDGTRSIVGVMVKGQWLPEQRLQAMLDEAEE